MKRNYTFEVFPIKRMLAIATATAILSASPFVLAQATGGTSSGSGTTMTSTNGAAATSGATSGNGAAMNGAAKGTTRAGDMQTAPADMHSAMSASDQQMKSMQSTGDIDRDYAMMMRAHHQGAIDMSKAEIAHGKNPEMKRMARKIMANNKKEMSQFDKWLNKGQGAKATTSKGDAAKGTMSDSRGTTKP